MANTAANEYYWKAQPNKYETGKVRVGRAHWGICRISITAKVDDQNHKFNID